MSAYSLVILHPQPDAQLEAYRDINGQPQFVYSWRLEPTDRLPAGKREGPALRELEPKITRDLEDKISPRGGDMTVMELVQKYLRTKTGVRSSTRAGYKTVRKRQIVLNRRYQKDIAGSVFAYRLHGWQPW